MADQRHANRTERPAKYPLPRVSIHLLFAFMDSNIHIINKLSKTTVPLKSLKP
jgi:hypothetical protein